MRAALAVILLGGIVGTGSAQTSASGITYTVSSRSHRAGPLANMGPPPDAAWTGVVLWANGRGRMDITAGSQPSQFDAGDYVLFDSTDYVVVRTASKTFYGLPPDLAAHAAAGPQSIGSLMSMSIADATAKLDTVGSDSIAGAPARHYRMLSHATMHMDMPNAGATPSFESTTTIDYWFVDAPPLPQNPLIDMGGGSPGASAVVPPAMKELVDKQRQARAGLPVDRRIARIAADVSVSGMGMSNQNTDTTSIASVGSTSVDLDRLVLPDGFTQVPMPGAEVLYSDSTAAMAPTAKWRTRPGPPHSR